MSTLLLCGINYQTAPLALREHLVFPTETRIADLTRLVAHTGATEAVLLSTCDRTELYLISARPEAVATWLSVQKNVSFEAVMQSLYVHEDAAAVRHLLRVACGLDSIIVGETQILGQLKQAFAQAAGAKTLGKHLLRLANCMATVSKQVRTETKVGANPISLASIVANRARHIFADIAQRTILCIGAGETNERVARYLQAAGVRQFIIANRTLDRGQQLAQKLQGTAIDLTELSQYLAQADIVVAATASPVPVVGKGMVETALKARKHRPMFMVDLAVPRNIEPEITQLSDVFLSTLGDLQAIIVQNKDTRQLAAAEAEHIIEKQVEHYQGNLRIQAMAPVIATYRRKAEAIRDAEISRALQQLQQGIEAEQILKRLATTITNKLLHVPSVQLRQAAYSKKAEILAIAQWLLESS